MGRPTRGTKNFINKLDDLQLEEMKDPSLEDELPNVKKFGKNIARST